MGDLIDYDLFSICLNLKICQYINHKTISTFREIGFNTPSRLDVDVLATNSFGFHPSYNLVDGNISRHVQGDDNEFMNDLKRTSFSTCKIVIYIPNVRFQTSDDDILRTRSK